MWACVVYRFFFDFLFMVFPLFFFHFSSIKKVYAALLISAHKLPNSISVSLCSKMFLAISTILSVVTSYNSIFFNHSIAPFIFLFSLTSCLYYSPPSFCCQVFLKNCKIKKQDICPAFWYYDLSFFRRRKLTS